jgi:hypothetical protein
MPVAAPGNTTYAIYKHIRIALETITEEILNFGEM